MNADKTLQNNEKIGICGCVIYNVPRFEGLYCNEYCCRHCPESKISPCQQERKNGTLSEQLAKFKN